MIRVSGGKCLIVSVSRKDEHGHTWNEHGRHVSTGPDIDASRFVPVHICDTCGCLFAPEPTPTEGE